MNKIINLVINGKSVAVPGGGTILDAAKALEIPVPTLCHHPMLSSFGGCRLCVVELKGVRNPVAACTTPADEGMEIITSTPRLEELRKTLLELILSDHPYDCMLCEIAGDCELQELAYYYDAKNTTYEGEKRTYNKRDNNPFLIREMEKCILCGRCVKVCDEVQGAGAIDFAYRGFKSKVCPQYEEDLSCEFCGQCVAICPSGALTGKMWARKGRRKDIKEVDTICPYCGTGCGITLHIKNNEIIRVTSRSDSWNQGLLCVKGRFGYQFVNSADRLKKPLIREESGFREASWDEALDYVAASLAQIKNRYGSDAIAGLASAKCTNEENFLFQKFIRAAIGTNNVDHCARLCHAPTVSALAYIFGSGAMTNSVSEIRNAEVIFIIGSNTKESHPVIANHMIKAYRNGAKIIMADPRKAPMSRYAEVFLQHKPGTDVALLNGIAHVIVREKLYDSTFIDEKTSGFEEFTQMLDKYTPEYVESITGVHADDIVMASRLYGSSRRAGIFYAMGITQHTTGYDNVCAIANLALLTGNIGKPSSGINPLRGQNNVQGASDAACLPNVFPGYQPVDDPVAKIIFENAWDTALSGKPGLTATEMIHAAVENKLRAIYIMGENPVISDPNSKHTIKALKKLDLLVVQDIFMTETALLAHVVLPSACFAEKDGTFTNTDRHVQRIRKAVNLPGEARYDWQIISDLSSRLGCRMEYGNVEDIWNEYSRLWPAISGITYDRISRERLAWPCPSEDHPGTRTLYENGFQKGKAPFSMPRFIPPAEKTDSEYDFILTTGRNLYQYHTGSMTRRIPAIEAHAGQAYVEINPADAGRLGISAGEMITISSRRGSILISARITGSIDAGVLFIPMHYREAAANILTTDALDPRAKIPEFKVCAVKVEKYSSVPPDLI
jgi:formate dehydrogenase (NADP+) alpha subunit